MLPDPVLDCATYHNCTTKRKGKPRTLPILLPLTFGRPPLGRGRSIDPIPPIRPDRHDGREIPDWWPRPQDRRPPLAQAFCPRFRALGRPTGRHVGPESDKPAICTFGFWPIARTTSSGGGIRQRLVR